MSGRENHKDDASSRTHTHTHIALCQATWSCVKVTVLVLISCSSHYSGVCVTTLFSRYNRLKIQRAHSAFTPTPTLQFPRVLLDMAVDNRWRTSLLFCSVHFVTASCLPGTCVQRVQYALCDSVRRVAFPLIAYGTMGSVAGNGEFHCHCDVILHLGVFVGI